jgi:ketosteroid isomerase-like protein
MKKIISILLLFDTCLIAHAQRSIEGLIQAEKNFAAYSLGHGTKDAFLKFLDSAGIVFENGNPVNGIETWSKREKSSGILNWWPEFAEISNSNDFGYTTGPWTFQQSMNDSIVARGQYTTVWHIDRNGEWKFMIDLGVGKLPQSSVGEVKRINVAKLGAKSIRPGRVLSLETAERDFIKLFSKNKKAAYEKYLSKECILNRNGHLPAITPAEQQLIIDSTSSSILFTMAGWVVSPEQDMGFTYGTSVLNNKKDSYQRIWRREKDGWRIALDVTRY